MSDQEAANDHEIDEVAKQVAGIMAAALVNTASFIFIAPMFHRAVTSPNGARFLETLMREFKKGFAPEQAGFLYRQEWASYFMKLRLELHRRLAKQLESSVATGSEVELMHTESNFIRLVGHAANTLAELAFCKIDEIHHVWTAHKQDVMMKEALKTEACAECDHREECREEAKKLMN
jgi:hypothetical protein